MSFKEDFAVPSVTTIGSRSKKIVCFQCVGALRGPVLKLMIPCLLFMLCRLGTLCRRPSGHTSASSLPSRATCTVVSGGIGDPVVSKKVSK